MKTNDRAHASDEQAGLSRRAFVRRGALGAVGAAFATTRGSTANATASGHAGGGLAPGLTAELSANGDELRAFDDRGRERWKLASFGPGALQLNAARDVLVLPSAGGQQVLVANTGNARVDRFGADGRYVGELRLPASQPRFFRPSSLALRHGRDRTELCVADALTHRIYVFDGALNFVRAEGVGTLNGPRDLVTLKDGRLLVLDEGNHRVLSVSRGGRFTEFAHRHIHTPGRLSVNTNGDVDVVDHRLGQTLTLSAAGAFVGSSVLNVGLA